MLKSLTLALMVSLVSFYGFGPLSTLLKADMQAQLNTVVEVSNDTGDPSGIGTDGTLKP
ncbi:MAG: hypothetical protein GY835_15860 [bacterium]|nr:hypothetical protein [bacterium]